MNELSIIKVLWIEDSIEDQKIFLRLTKKVDNCDFDITWAEGVADAFKRIGKKAFDVVITDLGLPDGNGINVLNKLKDYTSKYPFVVLTGHDDDSLLNDVSTVRVFDYLVKKDLTAGTLRRSIRYAIGRFNALKEQEKLTGQLRKAQKMESWGKFTGGIAHDFNNKLAIILGNVDILLHSENLSNEAVNRIKEIKQTIQKSVELVKQLLASGSRQQLNKKKVNIVQVVSDSMNLLSCVIRSDVTVDSSFPKTSLYADVDPAQIDQVVMNLVLNAQDAIVKKNGKIKVEIESVSGKSLKELSLKNMGDEKFIRIKVSDNGQGMRDDVKNKILEPFFSTKSESEGSGLGLSVVDGIINQHDGLLDIKSRSGKGTCFEIYLPQWREDNNRAVSSTIKNISKFHHTVLLVEDEIKLRRLIKSFLEIRGFVVITAGNGIEGLELFKKSFEKIDVILSDVMMPKMNGKKLMKEVRKIDDHMGFVFVSGYSQSELTTDGNLPARTFFHSKPYNIDEVIKSLLKLIKSKSKTSYKKAS